MVFDVGWFRVKSEEIEVEKEIPRSAERSGGGLIWSSQEFRKLDLFYAGE